MKTSTTKSLNELLMGFVFTDYEEFINTKNTFEEMQNYVLNNLEEVYKHIIEMTLLYSNEHTQINGVEVQIRRNLGLNCFTRDIYIKGQDYWFRCMSMGKCNDKEKIFHAEHKFYGIYLDCDKFKIREDKINIIAGNYENIIDTKFRSHCKLNSNVDKLNRIDNMMLGEYITTNDTHFINMFFNRRESNEINFIDLSYGKDRIVGNDESLTIENITYQLLDDVLLDEDVFNKAKEKYSEVLKLIEEEQFLNGLLKNAHRYRNELSEEDRINYRRFNNKTKLLPPRHFSYEGINFIQNAVNNVSEIIKIDFDGLQIPIFNFTSNEKLNYPITMIKFKYTFLDCDKLLKYINKYPTVLTGQIYHLIKCDLPVNYIRGIMCKENDFSTLNELKTKIVTDHDLDNIIEFKRKYGDELKILYIEIKDNIAKFNELDLSLTEI